MAFDILEKNGKTRQSVEQERSSLDEIGAALLQADAIITMMLYHLQSEAAQRLGPDLLQSAMPLARLLASAAHSARGCRRPDIGARVTQVASMGKLLAITVEEEAIGQPIEHFSWLQNFIWALETQVDEVLALVAMPPPDRKADVREATQA